MGAYAIPSAVLGLINNSNALRERGKEVTMAKLKKISIEPKYPDSRVYQLRMDWDNGRQHAVELKSIKPKDMEYALHHASLLIEEEILLQHL